jgi:hypothetical protein
MSGQSGIGRAFRPSDAMRDHQEGLKPQELEGLKPRTQ